VCDTRTDVSAVYIEYLGDSVELPIGETLVGRDVGWTLRFNDPTVSRRHLRFIRRHDEIFVEDLRSANGTVVNGHRITSAIRLQDGDAILAGSRELTIRILAETLAEPSTMVLKDLPKELPTKATGARFGKGVAPTAIITAVMPAAVPSGNQRCPGCGAVVRDDDESCAKCNYEWGSFRPTTPTATGPNPFTKLSRRRHARLPIELHLIYVSSELEIEATTRDLSMSGVFVRTSILDLVGMTCELTMLVDGGPPLKVGGVVRRIESDGLGVEFTNMSPNDRAWLENVVNKMRDDA